MAIEVKLGQTKLVIVGMYLSCFVNNNDYERDVMMITGFIESIFEVYQFEMNCSFVLLRDFNFDHTRLQSERLSFMRNLLTGYNLVNSDKLDINHVGYTLHRLVATVFIYWSFVYL